MRITSKQGLLTTSLIVISMASSITMAAALPTTTKTTTSTTSSSDTSAASNAILNKIKDNTDKILERINTLPIVLSSILTQVTTLKENITRAEESGKTPDALLFSTQAQWSALGQFFQYGNAPSSDTQDGSNKKIGRFNSIDEFNNKILSLQTDGFANSQTVGGSTFDATSFTESNKKPPAIMSVIPNINDLSYPTAVGLAPLVAAKKSDPTWLDNYIKAASGASIYHAPLQFMSPNITIPQKQYQNYFNLAYAVQSFNNYILSKHLLKNDSISQTQTTLYRKASSTDYLTLITSEPIGYVLRDILLFQSQNYVLTSQLVELQRETLMATVMTNALLIMGNRQSEALLYDQTKNMG